MDSTNPSFPYLGIPEDPPHDFFKKLFLKSETFIYMVTLGMNTYLSSLSGLLETKLSSMKNMGEQSLHCWLVKDVNSLVATHSSVIGNKKRESHLPKNMMEYQTETVIHLCGL